MKLIHFILFLSITAIPFLALSQNKSKEVELLIQQNIDLKNQLVKNDPDINQKFLKAFDIYNLYKDESKLVLAEGSKQEKNIAIALGHINTYQFAKALYQNRLYEQCLYILNLVDDKVREMPKSFVIKYPFKENIFQISYEQDFKEMLQMLDYLVGMSFIQTKRNADGYNLLKKFLALDTKLVEETFAAHTQIISLYNMEGKLVTDMDYAQSLYEAMYWYNQFSPAQKKVITDAHTMSGSIVLNLDNQRQFGFGKDQPIFQNANRLVILYSKSIEKEKIKEISCKCSLIVAEYDKNSQEFQKLKKICP